MVGIHCSTSTWPVAAPRCGPSTHPTSPLATIPFTTKLACKPCRRHGQGMLLPDSSRHLSRNISICSSTSNNTPHHTASAEQELPPLKSMSERSLRSLDSLLGDEISPAVAATTDQQDTARQVLPEPGVSNRLIQRVLKSVGIYPADVEKLEPPKVRPVFSFVFYYWHIVIFAAGFYLDDFEGPGAGAEFLDMLTNDHLLVTQGHELWRLLTCAFVQPNPWALFITLMAVGALGWELEASMGYLAFGAASSAIALVTSTADIVSDQLPVTHGSLPMIAGLVGSLMVLYSKDTLLQEQVKALQAGSTATLTQGSQLRKHTNSVANSRHSTNGTSDAAQAHDSTMSQMQSKPANTASDGHQVPQSSANTAQHSMSTASSRDSDEEAEVEFLEGLVKVSVPTSAPLKAAATISTGALAAVEALYDLQKNGGLSVDAWGITAGLISGILFAWVLLPNYTVQKISLAEAVAQVTRNRQSSPVRLAWFTFGIDAVLQQLQQYESGRDQQARSSIRQGQDVLLLQDATPAGTKAAFMGVALAAAVGSILHLSGYF